MNSLTDIAEAFDEIISGRFVKRYVHKLIVDGSDLTGLFVERAERAGFVGTTVGNVDVGFDERIAAFASRSSTAYFGWVFIERFTTTRSRKLFGSEVQNKKGDWAIQVPSNSKENVYVNYSHRIGMEFGADFVLE